MAPIEKLQDGRSTGLGWPLLDCLPQQPTKGWCLQGGGVGEAIRTGGTQGGRTFAHRFGWCKNRKKGENLSEIKSTNGPGFFLALAPRDWIP